MSLQHSFRTGIIFTTAFPHHFSIPPVSRILAPLYPVRCFPLRSMTFVASQLFDSPGSYRRIPPLTYSFLVRFIAPNCVSEDEQQMRLSLIQYLYMHVDERSSYLKVENRPDTWEKGRLIPIHSNFN